MSKRRAEDSEVETDSAEMDPDMTVSSVGMRLFFSQLYGYELINSTFGWDALREGHSELVRTLLATRVDKGVERAVAEREKEALYAVMERLRACNVNIIVHNRNTRMLFCVQSVQPTVTLLRLGVDTLHVFTVEHAPHRFYFGNNVPGWRISFSVREYEIAKLYKDVVAADRAALATGVAKDVAGIVAEFIMPWDDAVSLDV